MTISGIRKFASVFPTLSKIGKYALSGTAFAAGLYGANKYYPFHNIIKNFQAKANFPTNVIQACRNLSSSANKWTFVDKQGNRIDCEWCDQSSLEKVRSVYIQGFLGHDFLEIEDPNQAKRAIDAVWTRRIVGYIPKFSKKPPEAFLVTAKKGSEIVGFVIFEMRKFQEVYVTPLVIHPSMQKTGLGKELIFAILKKMPNLKRMSLITMRSNTNAVCFYNHIGFKEFEDNDDHGYKPGELVSFECCFS
jgi:ribosomal protein S18 acetylase RimI-like enzyme